MERQTLCNNFCRAFLSPILVSRGAILEAGAGEAGGEELWGDEESGLAWGCCCCCCSRECLPVDVAGDDVSSCSSGTTEMSTDEEKWKAGMESCCCCCCCCCCCWGCSCCMCRFCILKEEKMLNEKNLRNIVSSVAICYCTVLYYCTCSS